jgi:hypothetical protein
MAISNASLSAAAVDAAILFFADFVDEPIRGAYAPCPLTVPSGLTDADADCEGFTFETVDSQVLGIGPVEHGDGGTDTLGFTLLADAATPELLTAIENPALYVGRKVRVWLVLHDAAGEVVQLRPLYRGYMTTPAQEADEGQFIIRMEAENYLGLLSGAQNRTYVQSKLYDSGDLSGAAMRGQQNYVPGLPGGGPHGGRFDEFTRYEP